MVHGLTGFQGLFFSAEAHFAFAFDDEVDFFLCLIVPGYLPSVGFEGDESNGEFLCGDGGASACNRLCSFCVREIVGLPISRRSEMVIYLLLVITRQSESTKPSLRHDVSRNPEVLGGWAGFVYSSIRLFVYSSIRLIGGDCFAGFHFFALFDEQVHPVFHVLSVVVPHAAADQIAVDDARFIDEDAAADFEVKLAFPNAGHASSFNYACATRDFNAVADAGNGFVVFKEIARDANEVGVVANVFGGATAREEDADIFGGVNVSKGDVCVDRIPFPFFGDVPARGDFVEYHLIAPLVWTGDNGGESVFLYPEKWV